MEMVQYEKSATWKECNMKKVQHEKEYSAPHYFLERNFFSNVKSKNITFLHVNNMWGFSLFIEQDKSEKK